MTDWDRYLSQTTEAQNSMQHSSTGNSPKIMLTGHEKALRLTFFNMKAEAHHHRSTRGI